MISQAVLAVALATPSSLAEEPSTPAAAFQAGQTSPREVTLVVVSRVGQGDEVIEAEVRKRLVTALEAEKFALRDDAAKQLSVTVGLDQGFRVEIGFSVGREAPMQLADAFACSSCGAPDLIDEIDKHVRAILPDLAAARLPEPVHEAPAPVVQSTPQDEFKLHKRPGYGLGMWGSGIGLTTIGGALTVGSLVGVSVRYRDDQPPDAGRWASLGIGLGATAVGIPLLIVGRLRYRENRAASADGGPTPAPRRDQPRGRGSLYGAGVGLTAGGGASLAVGSAFMFIDKYNSTRYPGERREFYYPGLGLAVSGGVAALAGVACLVLDAYKVRRDMIVLAPVLNGKAAGMAAAMRF